MKAVELEVLERLDKSDKEKVMYFLRLLINQEKYKKLKKEITSRKNEIKRKEVLKHDEIWKKLDV